MATAEVPAHNMTLPVSRKDSCSQNDTNSFTPVYPPESPIYYPTNFNMLINYSMELVWHGEFNRLFQNYLPHRWYLNPTFTIPKGNKWIMFKDSAKVRFLCKHCCHGWTSMKGRVVFWFIFDSINSVGLVLFRLFGQKCQSCSPKMFQHAMWYPEEVIKVVGNVFNRIGQEYYGFYSPPVRIDRRAGKPRSKHSSSHCQACAEGICPGEFDDSVEMFGWSIKHHRQFSATSSAPNSPTTSPYDSSLSCQSSVTGEIDESAECHLQEAVPSQVTPAD